jgi:hypothetical protein
LSPVSSAAPLVGRKAPGGARASAQIAVKALAPEPALTGWFGKMGISFVVNLFQQQMCHAIRRRR